MVGPARIFKSIPVGRGMDFTALKYSLKVIQRLQALAPKTQTLSKTKPRNKYR